MKHLIAFITLFFIFNISSFASDTPKQVLAKSHINQLPFSQLHSNFEITDSLAQNTKYYTYYEEEYFRAKKRRNGGIFLVTFGLGGFIAGSLIALENNREEEEEGIGGVGTGIFITATVMTGIGIPLWISGSSKMKKNREILEKKEQIPLSFKLTSTSNGLGIAITF